MLGWVVLGEIHVGTFAVEILRNVTEYFQGHIFIGLSIGFAFLFAAMVWPDLKKSLPVWVQLPKTLHERVHAIDKDVLPHLSSNSKALCERMGNVERTLTDHGSLLTGLTDGLNRTATAAQESIHTHDEQIKELQTHRAEVIYKIPALDRKLNLTESILSRVLDQLPGYFRHQQVTSDLKTRVGEAIENFLALRSMYGDSQPAVRPFSAWRPRSGEVSPDAAVRMAERSAQALETYTQIAQVFAIRWGRGPFTGDLFRLVSSWREGPSDLHGDQFLALLRTHYSELEDIERDYATRWTSTAKASETIS